MTKTSPLLPKRYGAGIAAVFSQTKAGSTKRRLTLDRWYIYDSIVTGQLLLVLILLTVFIVHFLLLCLLDSCTFLELDCQHFETC